jgi:hypothetical protein
MNRCPRHFEGAVKYHRMSGNCTRKKLGVRELYPMQQCCPVLPIKKCCARKSANKIAFLVSTQLNEALKLAAPEMAHALRFLGDRLSQ